MAKLFNIGGANILWENPKLGANFAQQDITLSDGNYQYLIVECGDNSNVTCATGIAAKGQNFIVENIYLNNTTDKLFSVQYRQFTFTSNTVLHVGEGTLAVNGSYYDDSRDWLMIPKRVIGIYFNEH